MHPIDQAINTGLTNVFIGLAAFGLLVVIIRMVRGPRK